MMDFLFKVSKYSNRKGKGNRKENTNLEEDDNVSPQSQSSQLLPPQESSVNESESTTSSNRDSTAADIEDDDDDFITNEVKRRLKELRRNSFMVLIPEEDEYCLEDEHEGEAGETSSNEWSRRDVAEAQGGGGFQFDDAVYLKYCELMLFFHRMSAQHLDQSTGILSSPTKHSRNSSPSGQQSPLTPSRSSSKKFTSPLRCLFVNKIEKPNDESEQLQQLVNDPYLDLETAYVAQISLTWEALHCQYTQLSQIILCQPDNPTCYGHSAQQFQQFQVLLQRFIENEPFEQGFRPESYARARNLLPKLLQAPKIQGSEHKEKVEEESKSLVLARDLIREIESSILTFYRFLKMDKMKSTLLNKFGNQIVMVPPLQHVQLLLEKKSIKMKELCNKRKGWKMKSWPRTPEDVMLLFSLIDIKVTSRVVRMGRISKEQLFWCEEKIKKVDFCDGKLQRDPLPILFPC